MKRFLIAAAALGLAFAAALTGCARTDGADAEAAVCEPTEGVMLERSALSTETDFVELEGAPAPVDAKTGAKKNAPAVVVPPPGRAPDEEKDNAGDAGFSEEAIVRKIKAFEDSTKNEPQAIQDIIDVEYNYVPAVSFLAPEGAETETEDAGIELAESVPEVEPATTVITISSAAAGEAEIAASLVVPDDAEEENAAAEESAHLQDMAADYQKYLNIEDYVAEEPARPAEVKESLPKAEDFGKDVENLPLTKAAEQPVVEQEDLGMLLPPPLFIEPASEQGSEAGHELSLEGFDDAGLEYFGKLSESLMESGG